MAFNSVRPIKAIFQPDGEVVLGEFTDDDIVSIANGGTGGTTGQDARDQLEVIRYTEFADFASFDILPESKRLAKDNSDGKLYYSHNNEWVQIGLSQIVSGYNSNGDLQEDTEVEKFIFNGPIVYEYDSENKIGTLTVDTTDITARLDIIEGDENTIGSIRYYIKERFEQLLGGVIPELDTLKEIATSLGDTLNFRNDFDTHVNRFNSHLTDFNNHTMDFDDHVDNFNNHLNDFSSHLNRFNTHLVDFNTHTMEFEDHLDDFNSKINNQQSDISNLETDFNNHVSDFNNLETDFTSFKQSITNFDDVDIQSPADGDSLVYDSSLQKWISTTAFSQTDFDNALTNVIGNFEYQSHTSQDIIDLGGGTGGQIGIIFDPTSGKYKASNIAVSPGIFLPFKYADGTVDDIDLISTRDGNTLTSVLVRFWKSDGTPDNIELI